MLRNPGPATSTRASQTASTGLAQRAAMASAISRGGRRAALASAIATGVARSPVSGEAGAASGTLGRSRSPRPTAAAADGDPDRARRWGVRHGRGAYRAGAVLLVGLALAGCSGGSGDEAPGADTRLVVRQFDGDRLVRAIPLADCDASDGACARVVAVLPRLRPEPDEACTQIYRRPRADGGGREPSTASPTPPRSRAPTAARSPAYDLLSEALMLGARGTVGDVP